MEEPSPQATRVAEDDSLKVTTRRHHPERTEVKLRGKNRRRLRRLTKARDVATAGASTEGLEPRGHKS